MKRLLIVDSNPVVLTRFERVLALEVGLEVCASCGTTEEALAHVSELRPDLILSDFDLPGRCALQLISEVGVLYPNIPVLIMSLDDELVYAIQVLRAGGLGFISKNAPEDILLKAIWRVLRGERFVGDAVEQSYLRLLRDGMTSSLSA